MKTVIMNGFCLPSGKVISSLQFTLFNRLKDMLTDKFASLIYFMLKGCGWMSGTM